MKTEFTFDELETYFDNLSPAEKVLIDMDVKISLDFVLDMHFEEYDRISLIELVNLTATALIEHKENMKQDI